MAAARNSMLPSRSVHIEAHKQAEIASRERFLRAGNHAEFRKPFGPEWDSHDWVKWATIAEILHRFAVPQGAKVLDVGCGNGWLSQLLSECGYLATGLDIAPVSIEKAREWAAARNSPAQFIVQDMEDFTSDNEFDMAIAYNALHHTTRQAVVIRNIANSLRPGGLALFGEPSCLHYLSPHAREVHEQEGWIERGVFVRALERDCRNAGLRECQRFFEGTRPYQSRFAGFLWQLTRLVAANVAFAPQSLVWMVARKPH